MPDVPPARPPIPREGKIIPPEAFLLDLLISSILLALPPAGPPPSRQAPPILEDAPALAVFQAPAPAGAPPFARGTWTLTSTASAAFGSEAGTLYSGTFGVGYHFRDGLSANLEGAIAHVEIENAPTARGGQAMAGGAGLLLRWHVHERQDWSIYLDAGSGILLSGKGYPAAGTHLNFASQAGIGATRRLSDRVLLMAGARWLHISNADLHGDDENPGSDQAVLYLGVMFPL